MFRFVRTDRDLRHCRSNKYILIVVQVLCNECRQTILQLRFLHCFSGSTLKLTVTSCDIINQGCMMPFSYDNVSDALLQFVCCRISQIRKQNWKRGCNQAISPLLETHVDVCAGWSTLSGRHFNQVRGDRKPCRSMAARSVWRACFRGA